MLFPLAIPVTDPSSVAQVRRAVLQAAEQEHLAEELSANLALIATEAAGNLLKHAQSGEIHIAPLSPHNHPGVEILAIDRGPGMRNVAQCLADGYSTSGTPGTGLGAIKRRASAFDIYSQPGKGTVLVARVFTTPPNPTLLSFGAVRVPYKGERACGDAWTTRTRDAIAELLVVDGLGHGVLAADAATAATSAFERARPASPTETLQTIHAALRSTRGAAVAIAAVDLTAHRILYSGLGNIAGAVVTPAKTQSMISHNGTAGHQARNVQQFEYPFPTGAILVMHSDGLSANWTLDPTLLRHDPSIIAGVLYRDASRGRDDSCVVVARSAS